MGRPENGERGLIRLKTSHQGLRASGVVRSPGMAGVSITAVTTVGGDELLQRKLRAGREPKRQGTDFLRGGIFRI
jgi:hypothetical protein